MSSTDVPRDGGGVSAPDATDEERQAAAERWQAAQERKAPPPATLEEVLARGPQPPPDKIAEIQEMLAESEGRQAPSIVEMRDRAREEQAEQKELEETGPAKPLSEEEASAALSLMLSAAKPAPPEDDWFKIDRLTKMLGAPFWVHLRGLTDGEYEQLQQGAYREPTKLERDAGMTGPVQDRTMLNRMVLVRAILSPQMSDEELITKFGPSPIDVVHKWFSPGEINTLAAYVSDMSGYAAGAVQRAKE